MGGFVVFNIQVDDMQPIEMRRRIRELLSIPERDRTDAEWDELNELEIRTAPGNRDYDRTQDRQADRRQGTLMGQSRRPERNKPQGNRNGNVFRPQTEGRPEVQGRMLKRQHRRPKKPMDGQNSVDGQNGMGGQSPIIVELPAADDKTEG
jgi:hypothetical protein